MLTKKKRSETTHRYRNLRNGHVDQLGVGFRHGQRGHATAVPSERGERKRHPHSPGISSRQPRGHLGRNEDSVVVHVSLSLFLSRTSSTDRPSIFTPRFTSFATFFSNLLRKSRILLHGISPFIILRFTLCRIEPIEGRASFPEVNSKSFNFLSLFSRVSRFSTGLEFLEEFLGEPAFMTRFLYIKWFSVNEF